jgi:diguanylate cyclase (GGDEF)-like protein
VFLGVGLVAVMVTAAFPAVSAPLVNGQILVTVAAIGYGIRRHRPTSKAPWVLLAAAPSVSVIGGVYSMVIGARPPFPSFPDACDIALYVLLMAGLLTWAKPAPGRSRWEGAVDSGVVTSGAVVLSWTAIIDPVLRIDGLSTSELVGGLMFPVLDLLLLSVAARTVFFVGVRSIASLLTVLGLASLLAADSLLLVLLVHGYTSGDHPLVLAGWMLTSVLIGAAGLHPSMAETGRHIDTGGAVVSRGRIRMYVLLTFLIPALTIGGTLSSGAGGVAATRLIVPLLAAAAMSSLLLLRLNQLAAVTHRRATELDERTVALGAALKEQESLQDELRHQALHDPLTDLGNRAMLREAMDALLLTRPTRGTHGLLLLDLDGFKNINDTLGHPAGDELLLEVARRLRVATPPESTLVRLGGDEFAILIAGSTHDGILGVAEDVLTATRAPYRIADWERVLTTSIGIRMINGPTTPTEAMREADVALYAAKGAGKNQMVVHAQKVPVG